LDADLSRAYNHHAAGRGGQVRWPDTDPPSYAELLTWQTQRASDGAQDSDAAYWSAELDGAPTTLTLPTSRPRPARFSHRGAKVRRALPQRVRHAVDQIAQAYAVTPYTVFLSVFGVLLHALTAEEDVVVGSSSAGRPTVDLERTVGFFANTMPLRLRLNGSMPLPELLLKVQAAALRALEHQYLPFERLAAGAARQGDTSRTALVQVFFAYQGQGRPNAALDGLAVQPALIDRGATKLDFVLEVEDAGPASDPDGSLLTAEFATDLYDSQTVIGWLERYAKLVEQVLATPGATVDDLLWVV
jgi:non-ribosomal peptide synthetase component F